LQYIVDGGIHPDLPTGNIQTTIMVVAEAAIAKIMAAK
jgi:cellobiose dehydrogenase (acceptor)